MQEDLTSSCYRYGGMCDLRTDLANDKKGSYKTGGSLVGSAVLATTFTAIGHGCSKDPVSGSPVATTPADAGRR